MVQPDQSWWSEAIAKAKAFDDRVDIWPPPILAALVEAASRTGLVRFFPFQSVSFLRFATSPLWYEGEGYVAPAYIELVSRPDRYMVYSGPLFNAELVLETDDPAAAVGRAEELLVS